MSDTNEPSRPTDTTKRSHKTNFTGFSSLSPEIYLKQLYAGGIAGCVAKSCVAPLERVKFLYQVKSPLYSIDKGIFRTLMDIYKHENISGWWKGNTSSMLRVFPYASIMFSTNENCVRLFAEHVSVDERTGKIPYYGYFLCGSIAGCTAVIFTYPLDLLRLRLALQFNTRMYNGVVDATRKIISEEGGIKALFKGMRATLQGIFFYSGINFYTYSSMKKYYTIHIAEDPNAPLPKMVSLTAGCSAGLVGQTLTYPIDIVRRRMQLYGYKSPDFQVQYKYDGVYSAIKEIYRTEGRQALYRGLSLNWIKAAPLTGISFTIFEYLKKEMGVKRESG